MNYVVPNFAVFAGSASVVSEVLVRSHVRLVTRCALPRPGIFKKRIEREQYHHDKLCEHMRDRKAAQAMFDFSAVSVHLQFGFALIGCQQLRMSPQLGTHHEVASDASSLRRLGRPSV